MFLAASKKCPDLGLASNYSMLPRGAEALAEPHKLFILKGKQNRPQATSKPLLSEWNPATLNHMVEYSTEPLDSVFHSLSDATRRGILQQLTDVEKTVGEIAQPYRMSLAAVSKHVGVLERAGLVRVARRGNRHFVRLRPETLRLAHNWLGYYEQSVEAALEALLDDPEPDAS